MRKFGEELRKFRLSAKITLKELSGHLGWSIVYLSDIELGNRNPPSKDKIFSIAKFIGCDFDHLFNLSNIEKGKIVLTLSGKSKSVVNLALMLSRNWDSITDKSLIEIKKVLRG